MRLVNLEAKFSHPHPPPLNSRIRIMILHPVGITGDAVIIVILMLIGMLAVMIIVRVAEEVDEVVEDTAVIIMVIKTATINKRVDTVIAGIDSNHIIHKIFLDPTAMRATTSFIRLCSKTHGKSSLTVTMQSKTVELANLQAKFPLHRLIINTRPRKTTSLVQRNQPKHPQTHKQLRPQPIYNKLPLTNRSRSSSGCRVSCMNFWNQTKVNLLGMQSKLFFTFLPASKLVGFN